MLPVQNAKDKFIKMLADAGPILIEAEPGAGKTMFVPAWLTQQSKRPVALCVPRRSVAASVRAGIEHFHPELRVGLETGWGAERSKADDIVVMTNGVMLARAIKDPLFEDFDAVVLDEFHERQIEGDLVLGALKIAESVRDELRTIIMSATIDVEPLQQYLPGMMHLQIAGRSHPLKIKYAQEPKARLDISQVNARWIANELVAYAQSQPKDNILVFCPGVKEIDKIRQALNHKNHVVYPLHGRLSAREQMKALNAKERKVILSTNIAESALTIEGVNAVFDLGLTRRTFFHLDTGITTLETGLASEKSVIQRAGRAGRMGPGRVVRLWSQTQGMRGRSDDKADIERVDPTRPYWLCQRLFGTDGARDFADVLLTPFPVAYVDYAQKRLKRMGFWEEKTQAALVEATERYPFTPELSRLCYFAQKDSVEAEALAIIISLIIREGLYRGVSDLELALNRFQDDLVEHPKRLSRLLRLGERLQNRTWTASWILTAVIPLGVRQDWMVRALSFDMAKRTQPKSNRYKSARGYQLECFDEEAQELLIVFEAQRLRQATRSTNVIRRYIGVDENWLFDHVSDVVAIRAEVELKKSQPPRFYTAQAVDALILKKKQTKDVSEDLMHGAYQDWVLENSRSFIPKEGAFVPLRARTAFCQKYDTDFRWPDVSDLGLLSAACAAHYPLTSVKPLEKYDFMHWLKMTLGYEGLARLDDLAPQHIELPDGLRIKLSYLKAVDEGRPILAAKIQQLFGLKETPTVLGGKTRVMVHFCAPNMRPQQMTDDVAGFWERTYGEVRKQLRGRYPKHKWPEPSEL